MTFQTASFITATKPIIADVCFRGGDIDAWGRGTIKIIYTCKQADLPKPEMSELDGGFIISLFKDNITPEQLTKHGLNGRLFLPKFAFKYRENSLFWDKLLKEKTAILIVTTDTPKWYYSLIYKNPGHNSMKKGIIEFCGIKPVKITAFEPIRFSNAKERQKWINQIERLEQKQK